MLDGGKGQLSAVADLLTAENIAYLGRVKSGDHTRNASVSIVVPSSLRAERSNPDDQTTGLLRLKPLNDRYKIIELPPDSHLSKLIARLDDEAHRFAISYHTHLKRKSMLK
jgi:excinuclease UvrABC nuclease subunit